MPQRVGPQTYDFDGYPYLIAGDGTEIATGYNGAFYLRDPRILRWWEMVGPPGEPGHIEISLRAATYANYPAVTEIAAPLIVGGSKNSSREYGVVSIAIPGDSWVTVYVVSSSGFTEWVGLTLGLEQVP